jgi:hypothetical protein
MTQEHPDETVSGPLAPALSALIPPIPDTPVLFFVAYPFLSCRSVFSGRTATLTGVGCVLNTGTSAADNDFESGDSMPFPMHISLILSPPEHVGMPFENVVH